jgi:hypothetical protein
MATCGGLSVNSSVRIVAVAAPDVSGCCVPPATVRLGPAARTRSRTPALEGTKPCPGGGLAAPHPLGVDRSDRRPGAAAADPLPPLLLRAGAELTVAPAVTAMAVPTATHAPTTLRLSVRSHSVLRPLAADRSVRSGSMTARPPCRPKGRTQAGCSHSAISRGRRPSPTAGEAVIAGQRGHPCQLLRSAELLECVLGPQCSAPRFMALPCHDPQRHVQSSVERALAGAVKREARVDIPGDADIKAFVGAQQHVEPPSI